MATTCGPTTGLVSTPEGDGLVFDLEDKPWGPHYFRVGLDLNTDFAGQSAFNIKISHNRHWLDANGTEWRNQLQIGAVPRWATELYHPLNWTLALSNDWFVSGYSEVERREVAVYNNQSGRQRGRFNRGLVRLGVDLGQPGGVWARCDSESRKASCARRRTFSRSTTPGRATRSRRARRACGCAPSSTSSISPTSRGTVTGRRAN